MSAPKHIVVTGCCGRVHSGHVRIFEETVARGDRCVIVGHDADIRLPKSRGHRQLPAAGRRCVVGSIKHVKPALVSSGNGRLDAGPEIHKLQADNYAVNEEGANGGRREYCRKPGINHLVLRRAPAPGLPKQSSTNLRGF